MIEKFESIQKKIQKLPDPKDYYTGVDTDIMPLPENILLFRRTRQLIGEGSHHHRFMIIMNFQTEGTVIIDDMMFELKPGQAVVIFPFQYHAYTNFATGKIDWLFTSFEWPNAVTPAAFVKLKNTITTMSSEMLAFVERLIEHFTGSGDEDYRAMGVKLMTGALLNELLLAEETHQTIRNRAGASRTHELFQIVSQYIYSSLEQPIQIRDVAEYANISESHLRNVFTQKFGINIGTYIRRSKLIRACRLLETTEMSIAEVAQACGFGSVYAFSRTFRQNIGQSPNQYRNRPGSRRKRRPGIEI